MTHHPVGYTYGDSALAPSPVSLDALADIQRSVLWTEADSEALARAGEILTHDRGRNAVAAVADRARREHRPLPSPTEPFPHMS